MKIGIFGDSFGDRGQGINGYSPETATSKAWPTYISEEFDITNHCISGSSLYHSAKLFLETHHLYDKIIFLVTEPGRIEVVPAFRANLIPHRIAHYEQAALLAEETNNHIYKVAADYFVYFSNFEKESMFHYALLEKLKHTRTENVLFLPCFRLSFDEPDRNNDELFEISNLDTINAEAMKYGDTRHCHLSDKNNFIFAQKIKKWIQTNIWEYDINDFVRS